MTGSAARGGGFVELRWLCRPPGFVVFCEEGKLKLTEFRGEFMVEKARGGD